MNRGLVGGIRERAIGIREASKAGVTLIRLDLHVRCIEQQNRGQHYLYLVSNCGIATLQLWIRIP